MIAAFAAAFAITRLHFGFGLFTSSIVPLLTYAYWRRENRPRTRVGTTLVLVFVMAPIYVSLAGPLFGTLYWAYAYQQRPRWAQRLPSQIYAPLTLLPNDSKPMQIMKRYVESWENAARMLVAGPEESTLAPPGPPPSFDAPVYVDS